MSRITDIVNSINTEIQSIVGVTSNRFFPDLRLYVKDNERHSTYKNEKITLDDRYYFTVFHRILNIDREEAEDYSFGKKRAYWFEYEMICFVGMYQIQDAYDTIENIAEAFPEEVSSVSHDRVLIEVTRIETDQDQIANEEFGLTYEKHKPRFHLFRINYTIRSLLCQN